jgi:hypothetical protein
MANVPRRHVLTAVGSALGSTVGWSALRRSQHARSATFGAWLTGGNERPPVETDAFGFALFRIAPDETGIDYWLVVANLEDIDESHIHKGPPDLNGNVVAYLFGPAQEPVSKTGLLASGRLTAADMIWPLTDVPGMVAQMRDENVYVNVHTTEHPSGEIRGQIRPLGE